MLLILRNISWIWRNINEKLKIWRVIESHCGNKVIILLLSLKNFTWKRTVSWFHEIFFKWKKIFGFLHCERETKEYLVDFKKKFREIGVIREWSVWFDKYFVTNLILSNTEKGFINVSKNFVQLEELIRKKFDLTNFLATNLIFSESQHYWDVSQHQNFL